MITKKNIVQHSLTAIISAGLGLLISYIQFSGNGSLTASIAKSERITWKDAGTLKTEFLDKKHFKVTYEDSTNPGVEITKPLVGFVFNANHLREILNDNRSKQIPDEVIFYFGQEAEKAGNWPFKHSVIHIIAVGMKGRELLINDADPRRDSPSIYDKADPCPPFCGTIKTD